MDRLPPAHFSAEIARFLVSHLAEQARQFLLFLDFFFVEDLVDMAIGVFGIATQISDILLLIFLVAKGDCAICDRRMRCAGRVIMRLLCSSRCSNVKFLLIYRPPVAQEAQPISKHQMSSSI